MTAAPTALPTRVGPDGKLRLFGQPVLRRCAQPVEVITPDLVEFLDLMMAIMRDTNAYAVAAPQVGLSRRAFVYRDGKAGKVALNPEIVLAEGEWYFDEACLSLPDCVFGITRPDRVVMRATDLEDKRFEVECDGLAGRVFQHECDHLDGVLCIDRATRQARRDAIRTLEKAKLREAGR